ncbi:TPA: TerB family tellurite resistance protein [Vibrio parahaemolyticus]|nr:TerB family tellurite resistance protein [Vibrio parahaemolyticus]
MLDILDVINEATKEANSFENHAAKDLTLEERLLYLQGLALVMNADGEIHAEEKEYIRILIKSFEMDESILDSFVEFAQHPDKDTVQVFFRTFRRRPIAQLFLFDALMMTRRDDFVNEREKAVVDKIAEQLEVRAGNYQDIYDLFCHIKNKDWEESAIYFNSHLLDVNNFKHLLSYYSVEHSDLIERTNELRRNRLQKYLQKKMGITDLSWGDLSYSNEKIIPTGEKISQNPVKNLNLFSYEIIVPYLQHLINRNEAIVCNDVLFLISGNNEEFVFNLSEVSLNYDKLSKSINLDSDINEVDIIKCPNNIIFKLLGVSETNNPLIDFETYIKSLGLNVAWIEVLDEKVYFPKINGELTNSATIPSIDIDAFTNISMCHSDGSLRMNESSWNEKFRKPCLGYISDSRIRDIGSSGYTYIKSEVNDAEGIREGDYYLCTSSYGKGVPDGFAIDIPKSKHDSGKWIGLKDKVVLEDLFESGCYLIK